MRPAELDMDLTHKELVDLVRRFRVCWEVWPEFSFEGGKHKNAFALELCGTHEEGVEHPVPTCRHCRDVYNALTRIAQYILPPNDRPSRYDLSPYDQAIRYPPTRKNRPEVSLTITIYHRMNVHDPLDDCQTRCLNEMKGRLKDLGAFEGRYRDRLPG